MKNRLIPCLAMLACVGLCACGRDAEVKPQAAKVELRVFAAGSMTEAINQLAAMYSKANPGIAIVPTFDSPGTLKTQIQEGARCDIFISAAQKQMDQLDGACKGDNQKNPEGLDFIDSKTRVNILQNKVVLVVPSGNPARIEAFRDISKARLMAIGNSDVPIGGYSLEILKNIGLDIKDLEKAGKVSYGSNVKEVVTHVVEGTVDCGIVFLTDASSAGLTVVDTAKPGMCQPVVYPAAVLKNSPNPKAAKAFLDYLGTPEAWTVFARVGFTRPQ